MKIFSTVSELRQQMELWKSTGNKIVFVPTMGNLHAGHMQLIKHAHRCGNKVVCSIFVNALQFDRKEDLQTYPRTPEQDLAGLENEKVDLVFMPEHDEVYAEEHKPKNEIPKHPLNQELCGVYRPGFFDGIVEVVARLFAIVNPDVAIFGEKDYQQLIIIKQLVKDLGFAIQVVSVPTQREHDGLAYSSRNVYLNAEERPNACHLYVALQRVKTQIESGFRDYDALENQAMGQLSLAGFKPDYVAIRDAADLGDPAYATDSIVILGAAWLGKARLIDNILLQIS
ncbi:MAG: pantoate--beta-alanine ligase [Pseudomonadota bacterium]